VATVVVAGSTLVVGWMVVVIAGGRAVVVGSTPRSDEPTAEKQAPIRAAPGRHRKRTKGLGIEP
jgi:hypothetical protein